MGERDNKRVSIALLMKIEPIVFEYHVKDETAATDTHLSYYGHLSTFHYWWKLNPWFVDITFKFFWLTSLGIQKTQANLDSIRLTHKGVKRFKHEFSPFTKLESDILFEEKQKYRIISTCQL